MAIEVKGISKSYGEQKVLDHVSLSLQENEVIGLLGPNGAGKSTLMKILTCYVYPDKGDVVVSGHSILTNPIEVKKKTGYLPEHNPLYLDCYIQEYLEFVAHIHKLGKNTHARVKELIDITGLGPEKNKKIGMLSKGYRQRVGLAQALMHNPEILILDEPTAGLDPNQLVQIRELIKELGKEKTILFSTHILQEVEAICEKTVIINEGKIITNALTRDLPALLAQDIVHVQFGNPVTEKDLMNIDGVIDLKPDGALSWNIETRKGAEIRPEISRLSVEKNWDLLTMYKKEDNLEQIFHKLTTKKEI